MHYPKLLINPSKILCYCMKGNIMAFVLNEDTHLNHDTEPDETRLGCPADCSA